MSQSDFFISFILFYRRFCISPINAPNIFLFYNIFSYLWRCDVTSRVAKTVLLTKARRKYDDPKRARQRYRWERKTEERGEGEEEIKAAAGQSYAVGETSFLHNAISCTRASHSAESWRSVVSSLHVCLPCSLVGYLAEDFLQTRDNHHSHHSFVAEYV